MVPWLGSVVRLDLLRQRAGRDTIKPYFYWYTPCVSLPFAPVESTPGVLFLQISCTLIAISQTRGSVNGYQNIHGLLNKS